MIFGKYHGCYKDDKKKRILPDYFVMLKDNNSPKTCADLCLQSGFQYAGVQYGLDTRTELIDFSYVASFLLE